MRVPKKIKKKILKKTYKSWLNFYNKENNYDNFVRFIDLVYEKYGSNDERQAILDDELEALYNSLY